MELQHFSHEHPLGFHEGREYYDEDGNVQSCNGCAELIFSTTPSYRCREYCNFYLHKSCAVLPQEKNHILHQDHPLTLHAKPLYDDCFCDCCGSDCGNFTYHCSLCNFDLDVACGSMMDLTIEHRSHDHPLTRITRSGLFFCDGCGTEHKGIFYFCTTCPESKSFFIHQDCILLQTTINITDQHEHPLSLVYSTPPEYKIFRYYCEICSKEIEDDYASYYCGDCRYFVHSNCATSRFESFMSILHPWSTTQPANFQADPPPSVVQLPVPDEFVSLINHFTAGSVAGLVGERERSVVVVGREFKHFSHNHPLILSNKDEEDDNKLILEGKCCSRHNKKNDRILCAACIRPINITTAPFYRCIKKCGFFLHISCAELPTEVQHPAHPEHPLILLSKYPNSLGLFYCQVCLGYYNGFVYHCAECENYNLDVTCGSLPMSIQHEAHKDHILSLRLGHFTRCHASGVVEEKSFPTLQYRCETCDYEVIADYMHLPREIRHKNDEVHSYILTYSPVERTHHSGQYICDICEEELDPRNWFYHCVECDHSFDIDCLPQFDDWSNLRYGGCYTLSRHPHDPLIFLPVIQPNTFFRNFPHVITNDIKCDTIGTCLASDGPELTDCALKCLECNFMLHNYCAIANGDYDEDADEDDEGDYDEEEDDEKNGEYDGNNDEDDDNLEE